MKRKILLMNKPDINILKIFFLLTTMEGFLSLLWLLSLPKSLENSFLFGYSLNRLMLIGGMLTVSLILTGVTIKVWKQDGWQTQLLLYIDRLSKNSPRFDLVLHSLSATLLVLSFLLALWGFTEDKYFLGILGRFGPVLLFVTLFVIQVLMILIMQSLPDDRLRWAGSILFGIVMIPMLGWSLIVHNLVMEVYPVLFLLLSVFYMQIRFRENFYETWMTKFRWVVAAVLVWLLVFVQVQFIPKRFVSYWQSFYTFTPLIMVLLAAGSDLVYRLISAAYKSKSLRWIIFLAVFGTFVYSGYLYYTIGMQHAEIVNLTYSPNDDEFAFIEFAIKAWETDFRYTGIRNQMPLYPYLQALFYRPDRSVDEFFAVGKQVNVWLSLVSLGIIFLATLKFLSLHESVIFTLIVAFGLYALKSGYFMAELLYYTLSFFAYLLMLKTLIKPSFKTGIGAGILVGLSHLTKASILPGFALFIGVFFLKELIRYAPTWRGIFKDQVARKELNVSLLNLCLPVLCFLAVVFPYGNESRQVYGSFFYNVNSTFYMWYDSYGEAIQGTMAHGDASGWPNMPAEDIPGPIKYFREHSFADVVERIRYGLHWQTENFLYQYSFFNYLVFLLNFGFFVVLLDFKLFWTLLKQYWLIVLFFVAYICLYFALYVWYSAISSMARFLFGLYLPFVFTLLWGARTMASENSRPFLKLSSLVMFIMVVIDVWYLVSLGPFNRDFGS